MGRLPPPVTPSTEPLVPSVSSFTRDRPSSGRGPREPFDTRENPPKETPCQVALGQLQDNVSGMPDQAATGLEQAVLQGRQEPIPG